MAMRRAEARGCALALALGLFALLAWAIGTLAPDANGLAADVAREIGGSGVANPVTAVLLNFRGYDTLLEVLVLALALIGAGYARASLDEPVFFDRRQGGAVLTGFARAMLPAMTVVAGYLLWAGSHAPGGAFQAAAVLAGAGLVLVLSGLRQPPGFASHPWRAIVSSGFVVFLAVAAAGLLATGRLLQYPDGFAAPLIVAIEAALAVSLGFLLVAFFALGGGSRRHGGSR
jgi:multisubunit Na+/H+ antiporter MnhB subunit